MEALKSELFSQTVDRLPNKRLIILDDDLFIASVTAYVAHLQGWQTFVFNEAQAAIASVMENTGNVLLTDFHMPHQNGLEVASMLRERDWNGSILLMSGLVSEINFEEVNTLGIAAILTKPLNFEDFQSALNHVSSPLSLPALSKYSFQDRTENFSEILLQDREIHCY